jgi:hypothetical protein
LDDVEDDLRKTAAKRRIKAMDKTMEKNVRRPRILKGCRAVE